MKTILDIAFPLPINQIYSYICPSHLIEHACVGMSVLCLVKKRNIAGFVVSVRESDEEKEKHDFEFKEILKFLSSEPLFNGELLEFFKWISTYYHSPLGEVVHTAIPKAIMTEARKKYEKIIIINNVEAVARCNVHLLKDFRSKKMSQILKILKEKGGKISIRELNEKIKNPRDALKKLIEINAIKITEERIFRDFFKEDVSSDQNIHIPVLTHDQERVFSILKEKVGAGYSAFLLHGVTGSGKTEVYMRLISIALSRNESSLILVPEIALTPQLAGIFRARFGHLVTILHSALSERERFDSWTKIRRGEAKIVLGARSAIFAPLPKAGLVVVDEEHDPSYKQEEKMRYNARDLAFVRTNLMNCLLVLCSATPSIETYHLTKIHKIEYLYLPERIMKRPMPEITLLDMKTEPKTDAEGLFSVRLISEITKTVNSGEQAIIFLNKRGFSSFLLCKDCGFVYECPNCSITLTHHFKPERMTCHYCGFTCNLPERCVNCTSINLELVGFGTEKIEENLKKTLPMSTIERFDSDTAYGQNLKRILKAFSKGEINVLVGTQLLAKGHDFPNVTLVGVMLAELGLRFPDFRASERTFQLLTQVSGRAGRGDKSGHVFIQTYKPEHYSLQAVMGNDYFAFMSIEERLRQERRYPPYTHLAMLEFTGERVNSIADISKKACNLLESLKKQDSKISKNVQIIGPSPAHIHKIKGRTRHQILLKASERQSLHRLINSFEKSFKTGRGVVWMVDVDPINLL